MFGEKKEQSRSDIERYVLEQLALQSIKESRSKRRWGIFFKFAFLIYLIIMLLVFLIPMNLYTSTDQHADKPHIGIVKVKGMIADQTKANASDLNDAIEKAFQSSHSRAVFLKINSPGGSPVQSDKVYRFINAMQSEYPDKKVYAICEDICASGGYYIASAADKIYANRMSIVGSIGVIASGFGFVDTLKKLGMERRVYQAGKYKNFLDPFSPEKKQQTRAMEKMLEQAHQTFIQAVKKGRGEKLKDDQQKRIFSGLPFSGIEAKQNGLIDGFGSMQRIAKNKFNVAGFVDYTKEPSVLERLTRQTAQKITYQIKSLFGIRLH